MFGPATIHSLYLFYCDLDLTVVVEEPPTIIVWWPCFAAVTEILDSSHARLEQEQADEEFARYLQVGRCATYRG